MSAVVVRVRVMPPVKTYGEVGMKFFVKFLVKFLVKCVEKHTVFVNLS